MEKLNGRCLFRSPGNFPNMSFLERVARNENEYVHNGNACVHRYTVYNIITCVTLVS